MGKSYNTTKSHKPSKLHKGEWIGVEIECFIPFKSFGPMEYNQYGKIKLAHVDKIFSTMLKKYDVPDVTLKGDGSIESTDDEKFYEIEINLLFNRHDYGPLRRLCELLKKLHARTNESCGLHVHLDCRDIPGKLAWVEEGHFDDRGGYSKTRKYIGTHYAELLRRGRRLEKVLPLMEQMVDDSRIDNEYCELELSEIGSGTRGAINMNAYREHKTIEVRLHQGTTKFEKIYNWIEFLYFVSRHPIEEKVEGLQSLKLEIPRTPKKLTGYVQRAIRRAT